MRFGQPQILWLLAATVPALAVFFFWSWRKRKALLQQFVQSRLLASLTVGVSATRLKIRLLALWFAVASLFLALARPQWGFKLEEVRQRGLDILVAIDTSRSMLATDIRPNRLARARLAALDLLQLAKTDRLGLIAFAGSAFLHCPLTLDEDAFRQSLQALDVGVIPQGGTALTEAIQTARDAFKKEADNFRVLVLITDGEDHEEGAIEAAKKAAKDGIKVFTIGVGTAAGELLPSVDEKGQKAYVKDDDGNIVKSRLNELILQEIATATGAFYLPLQATKTMQTLYERGLAPLPKSEIATTLSRRYYERYQWPLAIAIGLLIFEMLLPEQKKVRKPAPKPTSGAATATLALALCLLASSSHHAIAQGAASKALKHYQQGNYGTALKEFEALSRENPKDSRLLYNAGTAAYRNHNFESATENFRAATLAEDIALQQNAYYNLGNSLFQLGEQQPDPKDRAKNWELAIKQYETALKLKTEDPDAKHNLEFLRKKLEELKQQQKDQNKDQQDEKDQDKDQNKDEKKDQQNKDQKDQQKQDKNQDQKKQDQKDPSKKDQDQKDQQEPQEDSKDQKQDQQSKPQDDPQKEQKDGQKDPKKSEDDKKKDDASKGSKAGEKKPNDPQDQQGNDAQAIPKGQMSQEQAQKLLDSSKSDEKALIFQAPRKSSARIFKDW